MKLIDLLQIKEKPIGWSNSSYYRIRSVALKLIEGNNCDIEVNWRNTESVLLNLKIEVSYKGGFFTPGNRTYKTYMTEVRRYIIYCLKNEKKWKQKK